MREPVPDTTMMPCRGCSRMVVVPAGPVRAATRDGRNHAVFCSRRCNMKTVAEEGTRQQEALFQDA